MKKIFMLAVVCSMLFSACAEAKTLVAYFSWSGNTAKVARFIADGAGADLFEIKTSKPYTKDYNAVLDVAKAELNSNARPALAKHLNNMAQYDTVFVGYPCWWGTIPMAVFTFLEEYDFSGKRVIPFVTHGGSSFGRSINDIKKAVPGAKVEDNGLSISGSRVSGAQSQVTKWLNGLGVK